MEQEQLKQIDDRIQDLVEETVEKPVRREKKEKPQLKPSIYSLRLDEMKEWLTANGEKAFRAGQIYEWLYENLNGKNEQHGDNGRAIGKSQSHIGELEQQLNDPNMNRKDKEKIRNKIDRIRKTAQKKKKGENHSNGNKR